MPHDSIALALAPLSTARRVASAAPCPTPVGPGWFESSWDLQRGLEVTEEGRAEAALWSWIDSFLVAAPVQPRAERVASPRAMTAIA
jgi:hypothetical protein